MSEEGKNKGQGQQSDKGQSNDSGKGKGKGWESFGESKSHQENLQKGMEIKPKPVEKPKK